MANIYEITESIITRRGEPKAAFVGDINLPEQYLPSELDKFWKGLYDLDPTGHYNGCIWFESGCWAFLNQHLGEWIWDFVTVPPIPDYLKK